MSVFMKPQYIEDSAYMVESDQGPSIVPAHLVGPKPDLEDFADYCQGEPASFELLPEGICYRLSASGYMDCTDWHYAKTLQEAKDDLESLYDIDPETGEVLTD